MFRLGQQGTPAECPIMWDSGRPVFEPEREVVILVRAPHAKFLAESIVVLLNGSLDLANDVHLRERGHNEDALLDNCVAALNDPRNRYRNRWAMLMLRAVGICPKCLADKDKLNAKTHL